MLLVFDGVDGEMPKCIWVCESRCDELVWLILFGEMDELNCGLDCCVGVCMGCGGRLLVGV